MTFKNNDSLNELINQAGQKIGENPQNIKNAIDSGKLDELVKKMRPEDQKRFTEVMSNPDLARQMLQTPQAQALIKKFMKN